MTDKREQARKRYAEDPAYRARVAANQRRRLQDPEARRRHVEATRNFRATAKGKALAKTQFSTADRVKRHLVSAAKCRAKKSGLAFDLDWRTLPWPTHCPALGVELAYAHDGRRMRPNAASLDRIDNSKGYVRGNVMVISLRANAIKNNATAEELTAVAAYAAFWA